MSKSFHQRRKQRGVATIVMAMIMLLLITLLVLSAFSMSTLNLKAVGNMQTRAEATSAAEKLIEKTIDGTFWNPALAQNATYDMGGVNYNVDLVAPVCMRASKANLKTASTVKLTGFSASSAWNTIWLLDATATSTVTGARIRVRQGVRVLMSEADKIAYCGA